MTSHCQLVTIKFLRPYQSHLLYIPFRMLSNHVAESGIMFACTPYTRGTQTIYVEFIYHLLTELNAAEKGNTSTQPTQSLKTFMSAARLQLEAHDIERVMHTVRSLLTDTMWVKAKNRFLKFIEEDYCKDFFQNVCQSVTQAYKSLLEDDLFTGYQYVSARGSAIADTIKEIVSKRKVNISELLLDMCFLHYYVNENPFNTVDSFLRGYIITSFYSIYTSTL